MDDIIKRVYTEVIIKFSDGRLYNVPLLNDQSQTSDINTYITRCSISEKLYSPSSTNILGNICSNSLKLEGKSTDGLLISTNKNSIYYGFMNNKAKVNIYCTGSDNIRTYMGEYFVDTWESGASSNNNYSFSISCVSLISRIKNININRIRLRQKLKFSEYIKAVIDKLNDDIDDDVKVLYNISDLQKLDNLYSDDWQMYYNNIKRDSLEDILNNIAFNTLTYIWIDRNRYIKVDSLIDEEEATAISELSGEKNLLSYNIDAGDIGSYSGLHIKYIESRYFEDKKLIDINDVELSYGINNIVYSIGSDKVLRVNVVQIKCKNGDAYCKEVYTYNNSIDLDIYSSMSTTASIIIYGTIVHENMGYIEKYLSDDKLNMLNLENYTLRSDDILIYTENISNMLRLNNYMLSADGFINPSLQLGDNINLIGKKLDINNMYKIIQIDFTLGSSYRCKVKLLKSVDKIDLDIDKILKPQLDILYSQLDGEDESSSTLDDVTSTENEYIMDVLGAEFSKFELVLEGY